MLSADSQMILSAKIPMVISPSLIDFTVDIDVDPLIEDLKADLRFMLEKISPRDESLIPGV